MRKKGLFFLVRMASLALIGILLWSAFFAKMPLEERIILAGFSLLFLSCIEFMLMAVDKLQEKTRLSITDELTGLYNDRYFYQTLDEMVESEDDSFALVKVAIDNLAQYNEKYGYLMGDALIKKVAANLRKAIRGLDGLKAFRYGGGQFLLLIPALGVQEVQQLMSVITRKLEGLTPPAGIPEAEKIAIINGLVVFPGDGLNAGDLIHAVNEDFEKAKEAKYREMEEFRRRSEKLAVVGQLAAGLAHEIRNPLTTVKGFCNLIQEHSQEETTLEYINILLPELDRVCDLVKEFLFLTKPAAPKLKIVNVQELIKNTITLMENEALLKEVTLKGDVEENLPLIQGDPEQLKQVFINLIINSIDAIQGKGFITVRTYKTPEEKIAIEIEDTGKGIPNEKIVKVFEPFFTTKDEGTGLGLSIANQIVHSHHGKMTIRSVEGKGTTVAIELPSAA